MNELITINGLFFLSSITLLLRKNNRFIVMSKNHRKHANTACQIVVSIINSSAGGNIFSRACFKLVIPACLSNNIFVTHEQIESIALLNCVTKCL